MVGVSAALHLQRRGRDVVLIDRRDPGEETSYGNAGLIQREAVIPYTFPLKSSHSDQHLAPIRKSTSRKTARKIDAAIAIRSSFGLLRVDPGL